MKTNNIFIFSLLIIFSIFISFHLYFCTHEKRDASQQENTLVKGKSIEPINSFTPIRVKDLTNIVVALEEYKNKKHSYPISDSEGWDSLVTSEKTENTDWIPGLAPNFLTNLPRDFRQNSNPNQQYAYKSNGAHYKLLSLNPDDCDLIKKRRPSMVDPVRGCLAYGFWTTGAKQW